MIAEFWSHDGVLMDSLTLTKSFISVSSREDDADFAIDGIGNATLFIKDDGLGGVVLLKENSGKREEVRLTCPAEFQLERAKIKLRSSFQNSSNQPTQERPMIERLLAMTAVPMNDQYAVQTALQGCIEVIVESAPAQSGVMILFDRKFGAEESKLVGYTKISKDDAQKLIAKIPEDIVRDVLLRQAKVILPEHLGRSQYDDRTVFVRGVESVAGFPVIAEGKVLAIFYLNFTNIVRELNSNLQRTVEAAANLVGLILQRALLREQLVSLDLDRTQDDLIPSRRMIGRSEAMDQVYQMLRKLAPSRVPIFVSGETGTGKELAARELHRLSGRSSKPFVAVNAAALPESLIESELFGHKRGAFTGALSDRVGLIEQANEGTLFIDEIGELPMALQSKLLRVLQEKTVTRLGENHQRPVDFRLITASHCDLKSMIQNRSFREDLYYRIAGAEVQMPALRKRAEDIILLAQFFVKRFCEQQNLESKEFSEPAKEALLFHDWPGNVRELEHLVERAIIMSDGDVIQVKDLGLQVRREEQRIELSEGFEENLEQAYNQWLKRHLILVLERYEGNKTKAAQMLGIGLRTLFRYLEQLNIRTGHEK